MSEDRSDEVARTGAIDDPSEDRSERQRARTGAIDDPSEASDSAPGRVLVLNGPNLGRLGTREPEIYGSTTYPELAALCVRAGAELGLAVEVHQSDAEAELVGWLHRAADERLPVVLNPAGLSHTSIVLRDAVAARTAPLVEVHISNIHAREEFRQHSYVSAVASGVIAGLGVEGYVLALSWLSAATAGRAAPSQ